ncbi:MAG: DsrE/DsrF/DrsH-like family protein [Rhodospirillaceae bacterium]|nr:DsrE/DsrF/DrsH-like family protein [Rhodospirillaceae bacterium]
MGEGLNEDRPDKLSLIVFSGDFDKVHYALVMASGAAAIGTPVTLFFTMEGARALVGKDGWKTQPAPEPFKDGKTMDAEFIRRGVADFETLLEACREMEVRFMVCEMGLKAYGIERSQLRDDITLEQGGVVTFINDASKDGTMLFI